MTGLPWLVVGIGKREQEVCFGGGGVGRKYYLNGTGSGRSGRSSLSHDVIGSTRRRRVQLQPEATRKKRLKGHGEGIFLFFLRCEIFD